MILGSDSSTGRLRRAPGSSKPPQVLWPKLYWELAKPKKDLPPRTINGHATLPRTREVLHRTSVTLAVPARFGGWPLFYSRKHGWTYRVMPGKGRRTAYTMRQSARLRQTFTIQLMRRCRPWASCFTSYHPMVWRQMLAAHSLRPSQITCRMGQWWHREIVQKLSDFSAFLSHNKLKS